MLSLNQIMLVGNLTRDPELRYTNNGSPVCQMRLAANRRWKNSDGQDKEETVFVDVVMWGKAAETAGRLLAKGRSVFVNGRLTSDEWEDKEGNKRSRLQITAYHWQFASPPPQKDKPVEADGDNSTPPENDPPF